jgi:hypothetical protein
LQGYEFVFATLFEGWFRPGGDLGTPLNSARVGVLDNIESNFNITFDLLDFPPGQAMDMLQPAVFAGDPFANAVMSTHWAYGPLIGAGLLLDLNTIPTLNLSNPHWLHAMTDILTVDGRVLGTAGPFTHPTFPTYNMHVNLDMWNTLGLNQTLGSPFDLVREGRWTWENFEIAARTAIMPELDRFGIVAPGGDFIRAQFFSTGQRVFSTNPATGRVELVANRPETFEVTTWMRNFHTAPGLFTSAPHWPEIRSTFLDGRALFLSSQVDTDLRMMEDDFGMLPMPKWNEAQPHHIGVIDHNGTVFGVPVTQRDLRQTGYILEALAEGFVEVNRIRMYEMADTMYRTDDCEEMLFDFLHGSTVSCLSLFLGWHTPLNSAWGTIMGAMSPAGDPDVAANMAAITEVINEALVDFFAFD